MKKQNQKSFARADRIEAKVQSLVAEILREREIPVTLVGAESHGGLQFVKLYYHVGSHISPLLNEESCLPPLWGEYARRAGGGAPVNMISPPQSAPRTAPPKRGGTQLPEIQKRLDTIKDTIRFELAQRMDQKYVPDLRFVYDDTLEKSERIDALLAGIEKELENE